tara:strand:- start:309 stop:665 length:357 start_codon:yes stop_codon:yes gene_type:complete
MDCKKIIISLFGLFFLSGCIESTALLGPAITAGTSGNIYQASLSYGTNQVIIKTTGKSPIEHVANFLDPKNEHKGDLSLILNNKVENLNSKAKDTKLNIKEEQEDFFTMVKKIYEKQN